MPFGKHMGCALRDIPDEYLDWLSSIELREPLRSAVEDELYTRNYEAAAAARLQPDLQLAREVIDRGYRVLAKEMHPDHGGDVRTMQALNSAATWLRQQIAVLA